MNVENPHDQLNPKKPQRNFAKSFQGKDYNGYNTQKKPQFVNQQAPQESKLEIMMQQVIESQKESAKVYKMYSYVNAQMEALNTQVWNLEKKNIEAILMQAEDHRKNTFGK